MSLPAPESYAVFCERVRCLCALHSASVTSGIRSEGRNARVGGSPASKHRLEAGGWAADLALDSQGDTEASQRLVDDARRLGLWAVDEGDHVHLQGIAPG